MHELSWFLVHFVSLKHSSFSRQSSSKQLYKFYGRHPMIKVSRVQQGNPLLSYLNNTLWHYDSNTSADYEINGSTAILFLSLKFHACKPEYIYKRINKIKEFRLKIVLVLIDVPNYNISLRELFNMIPFAIITCRSYEECSRYLRGFDLASMRSAEALRRRETSVEQVLLSIPRVNKTDVSNIRKTCKTVQEVIHTPTIVLSRIPGIGPIKAQLIAEYFKMPFISRSNNGT